MALLFHPGGDPSRVYYGTDTRAFDLLIGAAMAFFTSGRDRRPGSLRALRLAGLPALVGVIVFFCIAGTGMDMPRDWMFRGGFFAFALLAALLIASCVFVPDGPLDRVLGLRPLVVIGFVSYGVYLWHWPIIVFMNPATLHLHGVGLAMVRLALIAAFTAVSYVLIEQPVRYRRWPSHVRRVVYPAGLIAVVALIFVGTTASVVSPPAAVVKHFDAKAALPGVGGIAAQKPIPLAAAPSAANPLRVGIFGDSMPYVASPGLVAALDSTGVITASNFSFPGWGTSVSKTWANDLGGAIRNSRAQIVIGTWAWDNKVALTDPKGYMATLHELVNVARSNGASGVILLGYPKTDIPGSTRAEQAANLKGLAAWEALAAKLPSEMPGQAMFFPINPSVELKGQFSSWLPPVADPHAPAKQWERVRRLDGVHLCIPGIDRYATALTRDFTLALHTPPANSSWATGSWTENVILTSAAATCPADHP